jgi:hypothetical protein
LYPDGLFNDDLKRMLGKANSEYTLEGNPGGTATVFGADLDKNRTAALRDEAADLEQVRLRKFVADCFHPHLDNNQKPVMQRMESTLLWANGVFDARVLISNPSTFTWVCLAMADQLDGLLARENVPPGPKRLLSVSLRGSPFAAAASLISQAQLPVEIVDHMGPKHRILEEHRLERLGEQAQYIFFGDFVVGGTELKVAMTYAHTRECSLNHAVVIGALKEPKDYFASSGIEVLPLVSLPQVHDGVRIVFDGENRGR